MIKTQVKTALILHNSENIKIKKLQNTLKGIPLYPFYFICDKNFTEEPTSAALANKFYSKDDIHSLKITLKTEQGDRNFFLPLIKSKDVPNFSNLQLNLNVFQLAQIEITSSPSHLETKILKSRWIKLRF